MYKPFQRKINAKGFKDLKSFDTFIQKTMDKFTFVDPSEELYNSVGIYSQYIISNKSTIPDLIIYNKTFNKNDCFENYIGNQFNKFPRVRFILKAKPKKKQNTKKEYSKEIEVEFGNEEDKNHNEEESGSEIEGNNNEDKELTNPNAFLEHIQETEKNLSEMKVSSNNEIKEAEDKKEDVKQEKVPEEEKPQITEDKKKKTIPIKQNNFSNTILQSQSEVLSFIETKPKPEEEPSKEPEPVIEEIKEVPIKLEPPNSSPNNPEQNSIPKDVKMPIIPPNIPPYMLFPPGMMNRPMPMGFPQMMPPMPQLGMMNYYSPFPIDDDDEDENNPLYTNFSEDYKRYNPSVFLENPVLIVKKNLFQRNWILMRNNKVYNNYNSEELLFFLSDQIRQGNKFENMSVSDYNTDVFFKPSNLFDILRKSVPKLKRKFMQLQMAISQNKAVNTNVDKK